VGDPHRRLELLRDFLGKLAKSYHSSMQGRVAFRWIVSRAEKALLRLDAQDTPGLSEDVLAEIRSYLGARSWTALIVPSGHGHEIDKHLAGREFLVQLVDNTVDSPCLILQVEDPPKRAFSLPDVFPKFQTALAHIQNWPGLLVWKASGDSVFFPFGTMDARVVTERAVWLVKALSQISPCDLQHIYRLYLREHPEAAADHRSTLNILHLSDVHVGSSQAALRLPRLLQLVENTVVGLQDAGQCLAVVTGDLVQDGKKRQFSEAKVFIDSLERLTDLRPILILGNHDVRKMGLFCVNYLPVSRMSFDTKALWYEREGVGLVCFNSVEDGMLARGAVSESQLNDRAKELDRRRDCRDFCLVGLIHHHPLPVNAPDWYSTPFHERILGQAFESTLELEGSDRLLEFARERRFAAILHGHKHIPRVENSPNGVTIIGCGSSVGKVQTVDNSPYLSMNVVTVNGRSRRVTTRLLAERVPGGGLTEQRRHEFVAP
jgi:hypothetical protein